MARMKGPIFPQEELKKALGIQVGGDHYRKFKIQPIEYILKNKLGFIEGAVIQYVTRWKGKNGVEDLKKARHALDVYIEELEEELEKSENAQG